MRSEEASKATEIILLDLAFNRPEKEVNLALLDTLVHIRNRLQVQKRQTAVLALDQAIYWLE